VAPLRTDRDEDEEEYKGPYMKVIACAYTHDKATPSFFSVLDSYGESVDFLRLNNLANRKYSSYDREREEKEEDLKKVKEFIEKHRPDAVALSVEARDSLSLAEEIKEVIGELRQEDPDFPAIPVEVMDSNVAHVFSRSRNSRVRVCVLSSSFWGVAWWVWLLCESERACKPHPANVDDEMLKILPWSKSNPKKQ
jgi:hypothetical protein